MAPSGRLWTISETTTYRNHKSRINIRFQKFAEQALRISGNAFFLSALLAQLWVAWEFRANTWDDSAITLGFARTFAMTGKIEPTPGSGIVEGYSTTLWMLCMTLVAKIAGTPSLLLGCAKTLTLVLNVTNLMAIREWLATWCAPPIPVLVAGIVGWLFMFYETLNGMEAPLGLALLMLLLLLRKVENRASWFIYLAVGSLFVLTRWEAAWMLIPFVIVERSSKRRVWSGSVWIGVLALSNVMRSRYFGSWIPNTITAKRGVPYSGLSNSAEWMRHITEPYHILKASSPFLLLFVVILCLQILLSGRSLVTGELRRLLSPDLQFCFYFVGFAFFLSFVIGVNWGPPIRSFFYAWPFLLTLCLIPAFSLQFGKWTYVIRCATLMAVFGVTLHGAVSYRSSLASSNPPAYMPGATIENVARIVTVIRDVSKATGHPHLLYAGPDMGAIMLYAPEVKVIDLGLLCDKRLAHERFGIVGSYVLAEKKPDIILTHAGWTALLKLDRYPQFLSSYQPVLIGGDLVYLRKELVASITASHLRVVPIKGNPLSLTDQDAGLFAHFKTYDEVR